jgi:signal transduction histidine kinase/CHASE3 domain sensor protein/FixJ family two-component response regulator
MKGKRLILLAFSLSILVLVLVGVFTYRTANNYRSESHWVNHTQTVISEAQSILLNVQKIETSVRGYVITGKQGYLNPYSQAVDSIPAIYSRLKYLISDNRNQTNLLDSLYLAVNSKIGFTSNVVIARQKLGFDSAQKLVETDLGEALMTKIRNHTDAFILNEKVLLDQRLTNAEKSFRLTLNTIIFSIALAILIVLLTLYFFIKDHNRRIRSEQKVVESEFRIKSFLESLPIGVYVLGIDGKAYYANKKSTSILGQGLVHGASLTELPQLYKSYVSGTMNPYPADKQPIVRALNGEKDIVVEDMEIEKNGKRFPLRINATAIETSAGETEYAIAVFEDVTDIRETEKKLIEARRIAEESALLKESFLANMSHEIRTPMNAIIGFTDLLLRRHLGERELDYVRTIKSSGENLLRIINDVLDISKIESGMMSFEIHPLSIKEIFTSLQAMMLPKAHEKNLVLSFNFDPNLPNTVAGDPTRLTQVILNLVGNAIKFTSEGSIKVFANLLKFEDDIYWIEFTIQDTGIGISNEKLKSIFDRFTQAESHTNRHYGGTGLGLSIAKQLVELQGGEISVESTPNQGSIFKFALPFQKANEIVEVNGETYTRIAVQGLKQKKILIVEDNPVNIKFIFALFEEYDLTADLAENGKIAVDMVKSKNYDLVLMDLEMPVMNGYEATNVIRHELKSTVPIIAMSAHAMAGEREKCLNAGMNSYVSKPIREEVLFKEIFSIKIEPKSINLPPTDSYNLINLNFLIKAMRGKMDIVIETIDIFLKQIPDDLKILNQASKNGDFVILKQFAHRMKSSVSLMGIQKMELILKEIEFLSSDPEQIDTIKSLLKSLNMLADQSIKELNGIKENHIKK